MAVRPVEDLRHALLEVNFGQPSQHRFAGPMVAALLPEVRDLRRSGSAAAALRHVAAGEANAAWLPGLQRWDASAGLLLVHEAGGVLGDLTGEHGPTWPPSGDILVSPPALFDALRGLIATVYPAASATGADNPNVSPN